MTAKDVMVRQSDIIEYPTSASYPFLDINECLEGTHDCEQNCINTDGSYTCSCNPGFVINADRRGCNGEAVT